MTKTEFLYCFGSCRRCSPKTVSQVLKTDVSVLRWSSDPRSSRPCPVIHRSGLRVSHDELGNGRLGATKTPGNLPLTQATLQHPYGSQASLVCQARHSSTKKLSLKIADRRFKGFTAEQCSISALVTQKDQQEQRGWSAGACEGKVQERFPSIEFITFENICMGSHLIFHLFSFSFIRTKS